MPQTCQLLAIVLLVAAAMVPALPVAAAAITLPNTSLATIPVAYFGGTTASRPPARPALFNRFASRSKARTVSQNTKTPRATVCRVTESPR